MNIYHSANITGIDLFPHQLASIDFMLSNPANNMLVYQKMGYGKTKLCCVFALISSNIIRDIPGIYILVPNVDIKTVWQSEMVKSMKVIPFTYNTNNIILQTFSWFLNLVQSNIAHGSVPEWIVHKFQDTIIIVDEAHKILDNVFETVFTTLKTNGVRMRLVLVTATPVVNTPETFISLTRLISGEEIQQKEIYDKAQYVYGNKISPRIDRFIQKHFTKRALYYFPENDENMAKSKEMGVVYKPCSIHAIVPCYMKALQLEVYKKTMKQTTNDMFLKYPINVQFYSYKDNILPSQLVNIYNKIITNKSRPSVLFSESVVSGNSVTYNKAAGCLVGSVYTGRALEQTSCKFHYFINNLPSFGKSVCFFQNVEYGSTIIRSIMNSNGIAEYNKGFVPESPICAICSKLHTRSGTFNHLFVPTKFVILTGSKANSTGETGSIINMINSEQNSSGHLTKYVFISEAFAVAYSFLRFDSIHILTPRSSESELSQTIARVIRKHSHPEGYGYVKVYLYSAMMGTEPNKSMDIIQYLQTYHDRLSVDFKRYLYMETKNEAIDKIEKGFRTLSSTDKLPQTNNYILLLYKAMLVKYCYKLETGLTVDSLISMVSKHNKRVSLTLDDVSRLISLGIFVNNELYGMSRLAEIYPGVIGLIRNEYRIINPRRLFTKLPFIDQTQRTRPVAHIALIRNKLTNEYNIKIGKRSGILLDSLNKNALIRIITKLDESTVNIDSLSKKELIKTLISIIKKLDATSTNRSYIVS